MFSEKEAWESLSKQWARAKQSPYGEFYTPGPDGWNFGLCACLSDMAKTGIITMVTYNRMLVKLAGERLKSPRRLKAFLWDHTKESAVARAQFCKTQSELC